MLLNKRNKQTVLALLGAWSLGAGLTVGAAEIEATFESMHVSSQDHLLVANRRDPNDPTATASQFLLHENKVGVESGPFRMGLHISNRFLLNESASASLTSKPFTLEKKSLIGEWNEWDFQIGDSYQELGKGIALSLYQDDVFGVNHTLEGASFKYHPKGFEIGGFAGRVNAISVPVAVYATENSVKDRTVWLLGSSVGGNPFEDTKISAHYLLALNQPNSYSGFDKTWTTVGATIQQNRLFSDAEGYGEVNALISHINVGGQDRVLPRGWGAYATVSWAPSPLKVKWEGKLYDEYNFEFRRPPTLEEDIVETTNTQNVIASKWLVDYKLPESKAAVGASYLLGYDRPTAAPIHHLVGTAKWKILPSWDVESKAGYRHSPDRNWLLHASFKTKIKTFKGQYVELGYRKQLGRVKLNLLPSDEDRNAVDFSYAFSERISTSVGYEYLPENDPEFGQHFANVGASLRFGSLVAKAMFGQTSGGTLCSAGVCRQVPPFTGALFETAYTF